VDLGREAGDLRDGFAGRIARERAPGLLAATRSWRPDALVWDETDFAAPVVAERAGIPHVAMITLLAGTFVTPATFAPVLDELRAAHGLPADPDLVSLRRHLVLYPGPPSYRDPASPLPPTARAIRPVTTVPGDAVVPPWLDAVGAERPLVYLTLGTVFHVESGDLFERAITGLRELPVDLLVTVGNEIDPAELGAQPANVRIERFVPQALILPRADLVVSHGGSGSVLGALVHGRPMVLLAMGADQPLNGARVNALGLGRVLDPVAATPEDIRDAARAVLDDPAYRTAAARIRAELESLPGPDEAVSLIEGLVASRASA
jgi:UDP:flavonoid glycosyltransferase YjiC (YdhE family)